MKFPPAFLSLIATAASLHAEGDADELSRQATDPTASLMALNFQSTWNDFHGTTPPGAADDAWTFTFKPVIPFTFLEHPNILRLTQANKKFNRGLSEWSVAFTYTALFPTF
jgi:hypothetical protein